METGSPRKIQFTVPLLDSHLDPAAAEQIRRRRPTPATLVASSDQSSPEIDEDRLPNQLYKQALLNSPRQRRKGVKGTPTMKGSVLNITSHETTRNRPQMDKVCYGELQFLVEHHLYRQQQGTADDSSESCLSDRPSPEATHSGEELPEDDGSWSAEDKQTAEAFEKLRCQMDEFSRVSLSEASGGTEPAIPQEETGSTTVAQATTEHQTQAGQSSSTGSPAPTEVSDIQQ
ncbi:hypothetical protein P4O66_006398 [Electrophorus voltai]|uniref:Protein phosphatase 1 regulatory subunit 1A n=1 Tax=Electrophorus voltai TaxID=2609070 RepID=A0AAD8ZJW5_9TELE|nr:hypothetical protein P4O66_006398 [Electrophorus voltai]